MVLDIVQIKDAVKALLERENHIAGNPRDLSQDLSARVKGVFKLHPQRFFIQGTQLPAVTIYTDRKSISPQTIATTQLAAKRKSVLTLFVAGVVWNPTMNTFDTDPADDDCERLLENVEEILRSEPQLKDLTDDNVNILWQMPTGVEYQNFSFGDEEGHYRVGLMTLDLTVFH